MPLEKNVGGLDRILRVVIGTALLLIAAGAATGGSLLLAGVAAVGGAALLVNAATQFCGINALLGVDTCKRSEA